MDTYGLHHFPPSWSSALLTHILASAWITGEAGQKADGESACASILGTPEGSGRLGEKIPLTFAFIAFLIQSPFSPSITLERMDK